MATREEVFARIEKAKDFYEVLGIVKNADQNVIKEAYRACAKVVHPDRNHGMENQAKPIFQKLNEANETLMDPLKRQSYDAGVGTPAARASSPGLFDKLVSAVKSVCESISNFVSKLTAKQEQTNTNTGPK